MTNRPGTILKTVLIAAVFFAFAISACNKDSRIDQPSDSITPSAALETPIEPTLIPSPTTAPGKVWLVTPPGTDATLAGEIKAKVEELTAQQGYSFEQADSLNASQLDQTAKVVVWIGENADIANFAGAASATQFIMIGSDQIEPTTNLSLIRISSAKVSFMAGFITTLVAPDRRSGGLFSTDDPNTSQLQDSFSNGGAYLCGRCTPLYAPVVFFPVTGTVSSSTGLDGWKAGFDNLDQNRIEVLYIPAEAATAEFLTYLNDQGVVVVSNVVPPEGFTNQWVATVSLDPAEALAHLWPQLFSEGATGKAINAPIVITHVNDQRLTPGKLELSQKVAADLNNGYIGPQSIP